MHRALDGLSCIQVALLAALVMPAAVASELGGSAGSSFSAGVDADNQDGSRFALGLSHLSAGGTFGELVAMRSETSSDTFDLSSTYASGQFGHDFGDLGFAAGVRHLNSDRLAEMLGLFGEAFIDFSDARLAAMIEARDTDFEDTAFTASGEDLGLEGVTSASGTASCSVTSLGYGLRLQVIRPRWTFYASATNFDYDSHECTATITETMGGSDPGPGPGVPAPIDVRGLAAVSPFVSSVAGGFAGYSGTLVPRDGSLLESSIMAGASYAAGDRNVIGLELYGDREEFAPVQTNTALAYLVHRFSPQVSATLNVGATESDVLDNSFFAGVRFTRHLGH